MKEITLAIPFYNTSQYFIEAVQYAINDDLVKEILVSDDCSDDYHFNELQSIVEKLDTKKIKIVKTDQNLGGFRNKYFAVSHSSCDWIYLLDSDNHMTENTLDIIKSVSNPDSNICYCPEKLLLHKDVDEYTDEALYQFRYNIVGIEEAKDGLIKRTKWFDWFLNTGNYVFNRQTYLNYLKEPFENIDTELLHADVMALSYFWFKSGGCFKVIPEFYYYHRLRNDSYWNSCGNYSSASADYYKKMILDL